MSDKPLAGAVRAATELNKYWGYGKDIAEIPLQAIALQRDSGLFELVEAAERAIGWMRVCPEPDPRHGDAILRGDELASRRLQAAIENVRKP